MGFLRDCIPTKPRSCQPSTDDDVIYPVHKLDDTKTFRKLLLAWTISFNDVMDAEKLRCSLAKLLEIGHWRKLGCRLKLKVAANLILDFLTLIFLSERWNVGDACTTHVHSGSTSLFLQS